MAKNKPQDDAVQKPLQGTPDNPPEQQQEAQGGQTDDASRTQYLALAVMPRLPEKLAWKTMDNSFVNMTKALLGELMEQMLIDEQADFANAERHRAAMLQAENPLEYDYSDGWTASYEQIEDGESDK